MPEIHPRTVFLVEQHQEQTFQLKSSPACHLTTTAFLGQTPIRQLPLPSWSVWVHPPNRAAHTCILASAWSLHEQACKLWRGLVSLSRIKDPSTFLNSSSWKMDISKFTCHEINLRTTWTREDMLLAIRMFIFLRKVARNILNIYHTGKFITREAFPVQLGLALPVLNSYMGKCPRC